LETQFDNIEEYQVNGLLVLYNNMLQSLFGSQIKSFGIILLSIFVMFIVLFQSLKISLLGIIPNIIASTFILGLIGLLGIPLDIMTITIAAVTIGIAVDNTIHYLYKIKVNNKESNDLENSIENTNTEKKELNVRDGKIEIKDLHFSYDNKKVLENLHLLIPAGKKTALVGLSGSGKSTIISLLLHFFTNYKGKILIDDQNINDCSLKSLRNNIGLVTQETMLFNDTIETNIKYGNLNASSLEIEKAANEAGVNEFANSMPNKLNTIVGEGGIKLSGGQRQRIAIARALLKNAPILLLDEATSALDNLTEQKIQHSINQLMKNKTSLIVAHRLSTIEDADLIYVLDNGKIVDSGSHEKLLSSCKLYSQLHLKEKLDNAY